MTENLIQTHLSKWESMTNVMKTPVVDLTKALDLRGEWLWPLLCYPHSQGCSSSKIRHWWNPAKPWILLPPASSKWESISQDSTGLTGGLTPLQGLTGLIMCCNHLSTNHHDLENALYSNWLWSVRIYPRSWSGFNSNTGKIQLHFTKRRVEEFGWQK